MLLIRSYCLTGGLRLQLPAEQGENPMGGGLSGRMIDLKTMKM